MLNLDAIRVIIYDLDGTIYDDIHHFELYAREMQKGVPTDRQVAFWADYTAVLAGEHPALRIGTFYDVAHDLVLEMNGGMVERGLQWDGEEIPPIVRRQLYPGVIQPDHINVMNVGDLWWVPSAISAHYGGDTASRDRAFFHIRDVMAAPEFAIRPIPGLRELVLALKGKVVQVLVTNSPQSDSEAILSKVGLNGLLDRHYFRSNKPAGLERIITELADLYQVPASAILSIGDNLVNEIAPARVMGCQTVFIDPHSIGQSGAADLTVRRMTDLIPQLRLLAGA